MKARRIRSLLSADINLFAYHLPLDWHPRVGNNVTLGEIMGVEGCGPLNPADTNTPVFKGRLSPEITVQTLAARLLDGLGREPLVIGEGNVNSIACAPVQVRATLTRPRMPGGRVRYRRGLRTKRPYCAGARVRFIAAGHHATERYGVQALGAEAAKCLGITHDFIEIDNPV